MTDILTKGVVRAPTVSGVVIDDPNHFETAGVFRAPTVKGASLFDETVVVPDIVARLYQLPDLTNPVTTNADGGELARSFSRKWVETLNDPGSGELAFSCDDPDLDLIHKNSVIGFEYKGWRAFDIVCDTKHKVALAEGEESAEQVKWSGKGLARLLDWGEVYPALGILRNPIEENRAFNWTSPSFDDSGWPSATVLGPYSAFALPNEIWDGGPWAWRDDFPDYSALLLAGQGDTRFASDSRDTFFRQPIDVPTDGTYVLFFLADDFIELYVDGAHVAGADRELMWSSGIDTQGVGSLPFEQVDLDAGFHLLSWKVSQIPKYPTSPIGGVWALYLPTTGGPFGFQLVAHSGSNAKAMKSEEPPGMAVGRILRLCVNEFRFRGGLPDFDFSFTDTTDTNGNAWPIVSDISTRVGTKIGVFFRELCDTYIDLRWSAGGMMLDAYIKDGLGIARSADFHAPTDPDDPDSGNLLHLEQDEDSTEQANALLIRADFGWTERIRSPGPDDYGRIENLFGMGAQSSLAEVNRIADGQLDLYSDPVEQISGVVRAAVAEDDYKFGYDIGDTIAGIPDIDGDVVAQRVVGVAVTEDDATGVATAVPTFKGIVYTAGERFAIDQAKMTPGTAGGTSRVAQPVTPPGKIVRKPGRAGGWDEFIDSTGPYYWWRLGEATAPADLLVARDRMNRCDARYRTGDAAGNPPPATGLDAFDFGGFSSAYPANPAGYPYLVTGQDGLVSNNPNKAARFKDASAWVETPYTTNGTVGVDAWMDGPIQFFTQFAFLCLFEIHALPSPSNFASYDFITLHYPAAADLWRVGFYGDTGSGAFLNMFGFNLLSFFDTAPITLGARHLLVLNHSVTLGNTVAAEDSRWRGDWNPATIYQPGDIVSTVYTDGTNYMNAAGGNHYIANTVNQGIDPDSSGDPPWETLSVATADVQVFLDNVLTYDAPAQGFASPAIRGMYRLATSVDSSNGYGDYQHGLDITQDENVVWSRPLTADERARALELSGV